MLVLNVSNSIRAVRLHTLRGDRWPSILDRLSGSYRRLRQRNKAHLIEIHFFAISVVDKELQVVQD